MDITNDNCIYEELKVFINSEGFSCVAAKTSILKHTLYHRNYRERTLDKVAKNIHKDVVEFEKNRIAISKTNATFVCTFSDLYFVDEIKFEYFLWELIQAIHLVDYENGNTWAAGYEYNPEHKKFSFSVNKSAFFLVGLHSESSRKTRKFSIPAVVFNSHEQFEYLKEIGVFEKLKTSIRKKEVELQGCLNPNLSDFGDQSEAKQYSGRHVESNWKCPFMAKSLVEEY